MSKKRKVGASVSDRDDKVKDVPEIDSTDKRGESPLPGRYIGTAYVCITNRAHHSVQQGSAIHTETIIDTLDKARELICESALEYFLSNGVMKRFEWNYANQFPKAPYTKQLAHFIEIVLKHPPESILRLTCSEMYYKLDFTQGRMSAVASGAFGAIGSADTFIQLHQTVQDVEGCAEKSVIREHKQEQEQEHKPSFTGTSASSAPVARITTRSKLDSDVKTDTNTSDSMLIDLEKERPTALKWRNMAQAASDCDEYGFRQMFFAIGNDVNCRDTVNGKPREPYGTLLYHCVNETYVDTFKRLYPAPTFTQGIEKLRNQIFIIQNLINNKANVNIPSRWSDKDWFSTPLHQAKTVDVAKLLLDAKADIDAQDDAGKTPIMTASLHSDRRPVIEFLKWRGANLDIQDKNGRSAKFHIGFKPYN